MYIKRVQVEEGFLGGLDVAFAPGLNVIIGARGTGKTSLIELIRFCMDSTGNTPEAVRRSRDHALSILGAGQVTVTLGNGSRIIQVTRTASDAGPRATEVYAKPIIFSQTEIETVGLEPAGRMRLIDAFIPLVPEESAEEKLVSTNIASLTAEAATATTYIEDLEKQLKEAPAVVEELSAITKGELEIAKSSDALESKTSVIQELSKTISELSVNASIFERHKNDIAGWYNAIKAAAEHALPEISDSAHKLHQFLKKIEETRKLLAQSLQNTYEIWDALSKQEAENNSKRLEIEATARTVRQEIDTLQAGAGQVMRKGLEIREKKAKLDSLVQVLASKRATLADIVARRAELLDRLEQMRQRRYDARKNVVHTLNAALSPNIKIALLRNGQQSGFSTALSELLRGSGLRYNDVIPALSTRVSPRVLLEAVDRFDVELIAEASAISFDRASRVLSHLRSCNLGNLAAIDLDDDVTLQLLDGTDYKELNELSTGQRCTVVLPLVLAHRKNILIVDQPEDHIDNAFIAGTVIKSILGRDSLSQIAFSTHNPNIPVLGNADHVIHLGSDGKHGYVLCEGALNDDKIVSSISTVMEGGVEAFARRSQFYSQHRLSV